MRLRARYSALIAGLLVVIGVVAAVGAVTATSTSAAKQTTTVKTAAATADLPPPTTAYCERKYKIACYQAQQLERAYNLPALYAQGLTGAGQTIAIVVPFGSPTLQHDLAFYDEQEHISAPPELSVIQPAGTVPVFKPNPTQELWASVTDTQVELAHAIAPGANLLIVETPTAETEGVAGFPQIVTADEYVIEHHLAGVIANSFNATEQTFTASQLSRLRGAYKLAAKNGVTVLAPTGDTGVANVGPDGTTYYLKRVTAWPGTDPLVTAVGGTQLHLNSAGDQVAAPTAWNDTYDAALNKYFTGSGDPNPFATGGGTSIYFTRPEYQNGVSEIVGNKRGVPDISMSAACDGGAEIYQTSSGSDLPAGWNPTCGTTLSVAEFAGIVAITEQAACHSLGSINSYLYELAAHHAPGIEDVTKGTNTVTFSQGGKSYTVRGFSAAPGYDLATGVGTVNAQYFVPELALMAEHPHWPWAQVAAALPHQAM